MEYWGMPESSTTLEGFEAVCKSTECSKLGPTWASSRNSSSVDFFDFILEVDCCSGCVTVEMGRLLPGLGDATDIVSCPPTTASRLNLSVAYSSSNVSTIISSESLTLVSTTQRVVFDSTRIPDVSSLGLFCCSLG